jgi:hypothetical protein
MRLTEVLKVSIGHEKLQKSNEDVKLRELPCGLQRLKENEGLKEAPSGSERLRSVGIFFTLCCLELGDWS